ncbi:MAG: exodeoxyribonuclease VII small subunit [Gemmatimonadaceae bacterium]|nr:exodeoxyribonuclease VII small subunit [Gemmatimonadaceae bacterium]
MAAFEQALQQLESIVEELERPSIPLDRALVLFEQGIEHLRVATEDLGRAEQSVKVLVARAGGVLTVQEFDA